MLLKLEENGVVKGWDNATGQEEVDLKSQGYVESSEDERQKIIEKKHVKAEDSDTIEVDGKPKGKPGRKPKKPADGLGDGYSSGIN